MANEALPGGATANSPLDGLENRWLSVGGVLKPGVTPAQLHDSMLAMARGMNGQHTPADAVGDIILNPRATYIDLRADLLAVIVPMFVLFALVLLIACADLANLLLARGAARQREIGIRLALGASRGRIVRQLLTESLLLSLAGAAGGYLLARGCARIIQDYLFSVFTEAGYGYQPLTVDWRVFVYSIAVGIAAGAAFGLAPAFEATSLDLSRGIKQDGAALGLRSRPRRITDLLVMGQVTASLVLMVLAGLLIRSAQDVAAINPGYNADILLDVRLENGSALKLIENLKDDSTFPAATTVSHTPLAGNLPQLPALVNRRSLPAGYNYVDEHYFAAMNIALLRGRNFLRQEMTRTARVIIVSELTAERLWPNTDPLGKTIQVGATSAGDRYAEGTYQIVGVAADVTSGPLFRGKDYTSIYFPTAPEDAASQALVVRVEGPVAPAIMKLRRLCRNLGGASSCEPRPLRQIATPILMPFRIASNVASGLGVLALVLTCIGLYGVVAFSVVQRNREIGIRMALGAKNSAVIGTILRRSLLQVGAGVALGIPLCLIFSKYIGAVIPSLQTFDRSAYLATPPLLIAVACAAAYIPARRATTVDPMVVLRDE